MEIHECINLFLEHRRLRRVSDSTLKLYRSMLLHWYDWQRQRGRVQLSDLRIEHMRDFFAYLRDEHIPHASNPRRPAATAPGLSVETIDLYWRVLRAFWRFLAMEQLLTADRSDFFQQDRIPRPRRHPDIRMYYSDDEIRQIRQACASASTEELQRRNEAIILMLLESGMRASELCDLCDENVDTAQRQAQIKGKGGIWRYVFWGTATADALTAYLKVRRGGAGGPLFRSVGGRSNALKLTPDALRSFVKRLAAHAGVSVPGGAPIHAFRHTFAHRVLDAGIDGLHLQQLLGHADISTTMRYVREHSERLHQIHRRVFR